MNPFIAWLVAQAQKHHSLAVRLISTLLGAAFFLAGIPALVFLTGRSLDQGAVLPIAWTRSVASFCFVLGVPWVLTAVFWQLVFGKGTPVPAIPTKNFLQNGPYRYVRNPMMMGFFLYLLGWAFLFDRYGAFLAAGFFILLLLAEIKLIEEKELEKRFGAAYRDYKKDTPFLIPRWRKQGRSGA
ncbi:MAG: isoprenylcysteine carboxylmethyltransferase family protein [Candidatus Omnitrophica bacterium]|nr:isoprenylcysteine carboxylmethyltransferase family protein [Candidatus Omnitrophota bacterium]MDD5670411.1 isoprenylcysteine carboxylmethyltransferase family protein [Candidatus Omnitrophota bacterium]